MKKKKTAICIDGGSDNIITRNVAVGYDEIVSLKDSKRNKVFNNLGITSKIDKMSRNDSLGLGKFGLGFGPQKKPRDSRRAFSRTQKNEIWAQQKGKCAKCHKQLDPRTVEYDHGRSWATGGRTTVKNGRALCPHCHKLKTHKTRLKSVDKTRRTRQKNPWDINLPEMNLRI